jgi:hypothetical protein
MFLCCNPTLSGMLKLQITAQDYAKGGLQLLKSALLYKHSHSSTNTGSSGKMMMQVPTFSGRSEAYTRTKERGYPSFSSQTPRMDSAA